MAASGGEPRNGEPARLPGAEKVHGAPVMEKSSLFRQCLHDRGFALLPLVTIHSGVMFRREELPSLRLRLKSLPMTAPMAYIALIISTDVS
jgi:hypothetical protein